MKRIDLDIGDLVRLSTLTYPPERVGIVVNRKYKFSYLQNFEVLHHYIFWLDNRTITSHRFDKEYNLIKIA